MLTLTTLEVILGGFSSVLVGFTLSLVGGGGSILAVPLPGLLPVWWTPG